MPSVCSRVSTSPTAGGSAAWATSSASGCCASSTTSITGATSWRRPAGRRSRPLDDRPIVGPGVAVPGGGGVLVVLAGTSGAGKGTIGRRLREVDPRLRWSVSWTTRAARPGEKEGVDSHFVSRDEFERLRDAGGFLAWVDVYGDLKGTPRQFVLDALAGGNDVLLELDVHGALAVREALPEALLVFVRAPS